MPTNPAPTTPASPSGMFSCFISYSSQDSVFAEKLAADLKGHGVPVWIDSHDMKIGARIRQTIDDQIMAHDKLLLVLSENSSASTWVENEVEAALDKERKQNADVLFPIHLDDSVMNTRTAWAAHIRRARHMGDFQNWSDPYAYQQALDRLLNDLRS